MSTAIAHGTAEVIDLASSGNHAQARLCAFATGQSKLLPAHEAWLKQHVVPVLEQRPAPAVRLMGYASKLGAADMNQRLSLERAKAVRHFLERQVGTPISPPIDVGGYGESRSTGAPDDNSPIYRAVDVYIYPTPKAPPRPHIPPVIPPLIITRGMPVYMGIGFKAGGIAVVGLQTLQGDLYSLDDYNDSFWLEAGIVTLGAGLGGGGNAVFLLAYGAKDCVQFKNTRFDGWDFAVSLGEKWGDVGKAVKNSKAVLRIANAMRSGKISSKVLSQLARLKHDDWERLADLAKTIMNALEVKTSATKPTIHAFDIPFAGAGLELSIYKWWAQVRNIYPGFHLSS